MQDDGGQGTGRQAGSPCGNDSTSPFDDLDICGLDVFRVDAQGHGQDLLDIVVRLGAFYFRNKGGVEAVMSVQGGTGVTVKENAKVDKVEEHVSNDLAEICEPVIRWV